MIEKSAPYIEINTMARLEPLFSSFFDLLGYGSSFSCYPIINHVVCELIVR
ncbi:hypothetical protein GQ55_9G058200 [Panicum hallii var. hallii]|jgi:hypothetical protein|uniref:Uncharacterized protein n=1 Tax=Panicum hallii var. hallii TaxID=1504633 RepID=A0A2T7C059_9POAL|nr:hypothetical protein GQ55_9G058200 [Panicum hallii var. hallii]